MTGFIPLYAAIAAASVSKSALIVGIQFLCFQSKKPVIAAVIYFNAVQPVRIAESARPFSTN